MTKQEIALKALRENIPSDNESVRIFIEEKDKNIKGSFFRRIRSSISQKKYKKFDESVLIDILEVMNDYIRNYKAVPAFKQRIFNTFDEWIRCIAKKYNINNIDRHISENMEKPVDEDTAVSVVKALHEEMSKTDIAVSIGVGDRTVQNILHLLDPTLDSGSNPNAGTGKNKRNTPRFGGQLMQVKIKRNDVREYKIDSPKKVEKIVSKFVTENSLNPVALQLNVSQVGSLLKGMQLLYYDEVSFNSRDIAINIWSQLTCHCKERLKTHYHPDDRDFHDFIKDIEEEESGLPFMTEDEILEEESIRSKINLAFKGSGICNIKYNGKVYRNCLLNFDHKTGKYFFMQGSKKYEVREEEVEDISIYPVRNGY